MGRGVHAMVFSKIGSVEPGDGRLDMNAAMDLNARLEAAAMVGMTGAVWAQVQPGKAAVVDPDGRSRSFEETNANANRIVRRLRAAGLKSGDAVAVLLSNRAEFVEVQMATLRGGQLAPDGR
jgi:long-chain acyl-CoA synthetase